MCPKSKVWKSKSSLFSPEAKHKTARLAALTCIGLRTKFCLTQNNGLRKPLVPLKNFLLKSLFLILLTKQWMALKITTKKFLDLWKEKKGRKKAIFHKVANVCPNSLINTSSFRIGIWNRKKMKILMSKNRKTNG